MPLLFPRQYGHSERQLGAGTTARVYLYVHEEDLFAIKKIARRERESKKEYLDRVKKEVHLHRSLPKHHNLVDFIDFFVTRGKPYYVMEYLPGELCVSRKALNVDSQLCLFKQLALAVLYLQEQNVSHRDLKLANCRLTSEGILKLIDFGSSIHGNEGVGVAGSKGMVAPEVLRDLRYDSFKSDVWSLGVVFLELLGRRTKWKEAVWYDKAFELYSKSQSIDDVSDNLAEFQHIVLPMLEIDPLQRITMSELAKLPAIVRVNHCRPGNIIHSHYFSP
ncbi:hypothetical protein KL930_000816 [Ogataea haglerorum]|uniref:non-specific serine/threonine protein kinase n=1 Tax=Ogataea haglerorum TaxID=1937702 RepID=A0AAN6DB03_9ASCO|nr:uncharacterized protein KL911_003499 [Ogataea haglerorum]KAG7700129.1 hypothetical protein KL915_000818 [Ogataea haglerorum]KAG7701786.1 hypothetical protein KL951_000242 [Ogataea haglerorum]KAG7711600.1 hypothetical protein KL914_000242 [Ogataea haglerorum]KAG7722423.1 hypothetical protein KL913_000243 [Ogataea haglerorum]KAG7723473.1 hypothetical protein KL949_000523 [Ogataea haglerorum]